MWIEKLMGLLGKNQSPPQKKTEEALSQQEISFLLKTLSQCKFDGKDVLLLSNIVEKLSNSLDTE
jgi:hypothetical protein